MGRKLKEKIFLSLTFFMVLFTFVNAQPDTQKWQNKNAQSITSTRAASTLIVHYQRTKKDYTNYTLWLWEDTSFTGSWPFGLDFSSTDDFGVVFNVPLKDNAQKIGFVPVDKTKGDASKDGGDHFFNFVVDYKEIWVFEGDEVCYTSKDKTTTKGIISGQIVSETKISVTFLNVTELTATDLTVTDNTGTSVSVTSASPVISNQSEITITSTDYKTKSPYNVKYGTKTIKVAPIYKLIDAINYTGNDLGANYTPTATTFKLWAPTASSVKLVVYDKNNQSLKVSNQFGLDADGEKALVKANDAEPGVYSTIVTGDLKGYFYQYKVTNNEIEKTCLDPYAKSMAAFYVGSDGKVVTEALDTDDIGKGAIVDLSATNVAGLKFAQETSTNFSSYFKQREDAIIYEVHVRDFTSFWGVKTAGTTATAVNKPLAPLGTYKAFIQNLPYLKSMGYTHIQLLPIMNFYYGNESNKTIEANISGGNNNYNWGFDPHHYFTPEGMYATDEKDPHVRIKELKELVHAIHQNDMGVILDVVYTHMSKSSFLDDIVPNYYFFLKDGKPVGGFGNNLATTHKMSQKIMVDSIKYMLNEYKIDGFRFDMMGDGTDESIMEVIKEATTINPQVLLIGEGWRTFAGEGVTTDKGADQDAMNKMNDSSNGIYSGFNWTTNTGIGVFSDEFRNLMKSGFGGEEEPKFLTGGQIDLANLFFNIKGHPGNFNTADYSINKGAVNDPGQVVQYIAAHDNETLHDVIMMHTQKDPRDPGNEELIHKRIRMGNLVLLTSQGIAFMHAGQELGRTKSFNNETGNGTKVRIVSFDNNTKMAISKDSYDSSDYINMINWSFLENEKPGKKTMEYTKGLIKLRKSTDAFRLGDKALISTKITVINAIK